MAETSADKLTSPPDRLSLDPRSKFFDTDVLQRGIGVRFKGTERTSVIEYCLSEQWIRVQAGKSNDRHGNPMTIKLNGPVEVWFRDSEPDEPDETDQTDETPEPEDSASDSDAATDDQSEESDGAAATTDPEPSASDSQDD